MPNLTSLSVARATLTECGKARDAILLLDHDGVELAHAKPSDAAHAALTELAQTFNAMREAHAAGT